MKIIGNLDIKLEEITVDNEKPFYFLYVGLALEGIIRKALNGRWWDGTHSEEFLNIEKPPASPLEVAMYILRCRGFIPWPDEEEE